MKLSSVFKTLRSEIQKTYLNRKSTSWGAPEVSKKSLKYIPLPLKISFLFPFSHKTNTQVSLVMFSVSGLPIKYRL